MSDPVDADRSEKKLLALAGLLVPTEPVALTGSDCFRDVVAALPVAVYVTDADGLVTYYNDAAAQLWGRRPELGKARWCGSWKLFWPDGRSLPHEQSSLAVALRERQPNRNMEAIAVRPDGSRVSFLPYPSLLRDASGDVTGAVNMLVDITDRKRADEVLQQFASIVASSDDAIVSKDLDGIIKSWNRGAERLFGYSADEAIGKPVLMLIPAELQDEEPEILARIRRGERIDHFETVRRRKDGTTVEISLTVSPIRGLDGSIVGASKIARDITERRRGLDQQQLLLREMNHRIKNLFTLAGSIVTLSARSASTPQELAASVGDRLAALAHAHQLTLRSPGETLATADDPAGHTATLHTLIKVIVSPYEVWADGQEPRVAIGGPDVALDANAVSALALLIHEFTTNAAKYGSLSAPDGRIEIDCFEAGGQFVLVWKERGGPPLDAAVSDEGFGTLLTRATVKGQLNGSISREWAADGLVIRLSMDRERLASS